MNGWPLVGRERELRAVVDSQHTHGGVVVFGAAGVGKTRLAREATSRMSRWGEATWIRPGPSVIGRLAKPDADRRRVAVIDDAHLLDEDSAALLHDLIDRGRVFAVLTVRRGEPVPRSVTAMWSDELVARVDLAELDGDSVRGLLRGFVGHLDAVSEQLLIQTCQGNPLLLRELLYAGRATGALHQQKGLWRWTGEQYVTGRLDEVIRSRMGDLDPALLDLVELLAIAGQLAVPMLEAAVGLGAVDQAERRGLVLVEQAGERLSARLSHPMYRDVVRLTIPPSRQRRVWSRLVRVLEGTPMRRRDDILNVAKWRMHACLETPPELLTRGAQRAMERLDFALALDLAAKAGRSGGGPPAELLLAELSVYRGQFAVAAEVLPAREAIDHALSSRWLGVSWQLRCGGTEQPSRVDAVVEAARSWFLLLDGEVAEASRVATAALDSKDLTAASTIWALAAAIVAGGLLGREQHVPTGREQHVPIGAANAVGDVPLWGPTQLSGAECVALLATGRLNLAASVAQRGHAEALALVADIGAAAGPLVGTWCALQGMVAKAQGRARAAIDALTEASVYLDRWPAFGFSRLCHAELAAAHALAGDLAQAKEWLSLVDAADSPAAQGRLVEVWVKRDRAWIAAATGDLAAAAGFALSAADLARATGQPAIEALALFDTARFGAATAVTSRLRRLALTIAVPAVRSLVDAVVMVQGNNSDAASAAKLVRTAEKLATQGYLLYAAETMAAAHATYARAGHRASAQTSLSHAIDLVQACDGAQSHRLQHTWHCEPLTPREFQVAVLANAGRSSAKIAAELGLSVRTIDNYLGRVYTKLGIKGRQQLSLVPGALAPRA